MLGKGTIRPELPSNSYVSMKKFCICRFYNSRMVRVLVWRRWNDGNFGVDEGVSSDVVRAMIITVRSKTAKNASARTTLMICKRGRSDPLQNVEVDDEVRWHGYGSIACYGVNVFILEFIELMLVQLI